MSALKRLTLVLALLVVCAPLTAFAQSQSSGGSIEGTVTDESGAVLPGVTVTIKNPANAVSRDTTTDTRGIFRAPLLPVGSYDVAAALEGFGTVRQPDVAVAIGQTVSLSITLKVAATAESITVTAETRSSRPRAVDKLRTSARRRSRTCLNGRNFIDFVLTTRA